MRILSFDQSTSKVGYAVFDNGKLEKYGLIKLEEIIKDKDKYMNKDYLERICLMREMIPKMVTKFKIDVVGFEDTAMVSFGQTNNNQVEVFKKLCKALGCYETVLIDKQIVFQTIPAGTWRKGLKFGRKRDEIKANTIKFINKEYGLNLREYNPKSKDNDDDIADAIGIGRHLDSLMNKSN